MESKTDAKLSHHKLKLEDIDIHGTHMVYHVQTSRVERVFWILVIFTCCVVAFVLVNKTFLSYVNNPTNTKVENVMDEGSVMFPDVALCLSYAWNFPKLQRHGYDTKQFCQWIQSHLGGESSRNIGEDNSEQDREGSNFEGSSKPKHPSYKSAEGSASGPSNAEENTHRKTDSRPNKNHEVISTSKHPAKLESSQNLLRGNPASGGKAEGNISTLSVADMYLRFGMSCEDSLLSCGFDEKHFVCCRRNDSMQGENKTSLEEENSVPEQEDSSASSTERSDPTVCPFLHPTLGTCMVISSPDQRHISSQAGLHILARMNPEFDESIANCRFDAIPYKSFVLEFSDDYNYPTNDKTVIGLGMMTDVKIFAKKTVREPGMFMTSCKKPTVKGSRSDSCKRLCESSAIEELCQCFAYGYFNDTLKPFCNFTKTCTTINEQRIHQLRKQCEKQNCTETLCEEWSFSVQIGVAGLTKDVLQLVPEERRDNVSVDQLAMINVRHGKLGYRRETETAAMTPLNLISLIGGQIGLWLGGSVITLIEIILFCGQKLNGFGNRKLSQGKITSTEEIDAQRLEKVNGDMRDKMQHEMNASNSGEKATGLTSSISTLC